VPTRTAKRAPTKNTYMRFSPSSLTDMLIGVWCEARRKVRGASHFLFVYPWSC